MPHMNGPDAVMAIRKMGCDCFVVGITGNVLREDVEYFLSSGANGVLAKPVKIGELENLWVEHGIASGASPVRNGTSSNSNTGQVPSIRACLEGNLPP